MSGDVFGNGMLLSDRIRLIGAYDHRHIFIDPDPDPDVSFAERQRLFGLAGSSWNDYDRAKISEGGGVWPRTAKWIPLSEAAQRALGIEDDTIAPNDLIRDVLRAPVDLLWNGGIGTVVKASDETDDAAQDRSSDAIRVDASELRCRVVGEGGNLGLTRRARVEFARGGGRINADFIDNSAGVDCSDHEVNLKVLLGLAERAGDLTRPDRDVLLADVTEEVVAARPLRLVRAGADHRPGDPALALAARRLRGPDGRPRGGRAARPRVRGAAAGRGAGRAAARGARHGAAGAVAAADLREAAREALAARVRAARRSVARARPARLLPAAGGRALRRPAGPAPAAARAARDDQRQPRRQRARVGVRLPARRRARRAARRGRAGLPDRPRGGRRGGRVGHDRGPRGQGRGGAAGRADGRRRRARRRGHALVPVGRPAPATWSRRSRAAARASAGCWPRRRRSGARSSTAPAARSPSGSSPAGYPRSSRPPTRCARGWSTRRPSPRSRPPPSARSRTSRACSC